MTEEELIELRRLHAATTQPDWDVVPINRIDLGASFTIGGILVSRLLEPDMKFCAAAHNKFPALLDEIERLRKLISKQSIENESLWMEKGAMLCND